MRHEGQCKYDSEFKGFIVILGKLKMNKLHRSLLIIILLCSVVVFWDATSRVCSAQDWPQWRGPNRDGVIEEFSAPQPWPKSLKLKWKIQAGSGHSSPIVSEGIIYLHTRQNEREVVSSLKLDTGVTLWSRSYPVSYTMNPASTRHGKGPKSTPILYNSKLYTLSINGILSCFDAWEGDLEWQKDFADKFPKTWPLYGTAMSPIVEANMLIAHFGGHDKGALMAFDATTGDVKWSWEEDGPGYASPIVAEIEGTRQIVTQTQKYCVGISAATGELLWRLPFTTRYDQNIVTPVIYKQMSPFPSETPIKPDAKGEALPAPRLTATFPPKDLVIFSGLGKGTMAIKVIKQGDAWSTKQVWHNPEVSMYMNSPVLNGDLLFGLSRQRGGYFFCLNVRTGATLWTSDGGQGENAALLSAGEVLFFLKTNAELLVVKRSEKGFEPIAQYKVADKPTWAHPVVLGKQILIKDASTLALWSLE